MAAALFTGEEDGQEDVMVIMSNVTSFVTNEINGLYGRWS